MYQNYAAKKKFMMAHGGEAHDKGVHLGMDEDSGENEIHAMKRTGVLDEHMEKNAHRENLKELRSMNKYKKYPKHMAEGGLIDSHGPECGDDCSDPAHMGDSDMVSRIMGKHYSKGGVVANDDHEFEEEFSEPSEFDDLVLDDHLESKIHSDEEHGDAAEDKDRADPVMRAMMKRKKQHNPNPA